MTDSPRMSPREVVVAAYRAANRGRHAVADTFVVPELAKTLARSRAVLIASDKSLARTVRQLRARGEDQKAKKINSLRLINKRLAPFTHSKAFWRMVTRNRSLLTIEATRQVVRGTRAKVYLQLRLRGGRIEKDSEPLVLRRGKWLIGE